MAQVPVEVGTYLLNEKRAMLAAMEQRQQITLLLIPNPHLQTPAFEVRRLKADDLPVKLKSFEQATQSAEQASSANKQRTEPSNTQEPAVKSIAPTAPAPSSVTTPKTTRTPPPLGLFKRIGLFLFGEPRPQKPQKSQRPHKHQSAKSRRLDSDDRNKPNNRKRNASHNGNTRYQRGDNNPGRSSEPSSRNPSPPADNTHRPQA